MNIDEIKTELKQSIGDKLYNHSINTMNTAMKLAKYYGVDENKAQIAGILHDCGKVLNCEANNLNHAKAGVDIAQNKYGVEDIDILQSIRYHTTGRESMTMLDKIIYIADKIEPNRKFDGVEAMRKAVYEDIDNAIILSLEGTIAYVKSKNQVLDQNSVKTLNHLKKGR